MYLLLNDISKYLLRTYHARHLCREKNKDLIPTLKSSQPKEDENENEFQCKIICVIIASQFTVLLMIKG